jgi:hypothetical protein
MDSAMTLAGELAHQESHSNDKSAEEKKHFDITPGSLA